MNNDQLYFYNRGFNDCLAKGLNPVKTLTDEEIAVLIAPVPIRPLYEDLVLFARAILRKAQEK